MTQRAAIQLLAGSSLAGLLLAVGLRLKVSQVLDALRGARGIGWIVLTNFVGVPAMAMALAMAFRVSGDVAVAMVILAAAPFAPVVPVFTKMARGDLALAAALTALFPFLAVFLTPVVCEVCLRGFPGHVSLRFGILSTLIVLVLTITLPLAMGLAINHLWPAFAKRWLRPLEVVSEAIGACSLAFVTVVEFPSLRAIGWRSLVAMVLVSELSLWMGYALGTTNASRRVIALGTSNRNIALALLVALESYGETPVVAAVVANGLLLIGVGLVHVAVWRFGKGEVE